MATEIRVHLCGDHISTTLACDLPQGHSGAHKATIYWGDEDEEGDGGDEDG